MLPQKEILNNFKSKIFPTKNNPDKIETPKPTPDQTIYPALFDIPKAREPQTKKFNHKISALKLHENVVNKTLTDKECINNEIFRK